MPSPERTVTVVGNGAAVAAEAGPAGPAVQPGETVVWAAVTVTWALEPRPGP